MKSSRIILMANDKPGLKVARYLKKEGEEIVRLYIPEAGVSKYTEEIIKESGCVKEQVFITGYIKNTPLLSDFKKLKPDYIITVYWPWLLKKEILDTANRGTVNFHPALLPINRGWYPHVHSILDGSPTGVTIHAMEAEADTGPIWAQKEVPLFPEDTADTIYYRLQDEIVKLFYDTWPKIKSGKITPFKQDESKATYHGKSEINILDHIDLEKEMKVKDVINLLRARSFRNKGFAYFKIGEKKIYINIRLNNSPDFK